MNNCKIVFTGLGPISSVGVGKNEFWENAKSGRTNIQKEIYCLDGEILEEYYIHKVNNFDVNNYGLDKQRLFELNTWKNGAGVKDLEYMLASSKMAIDDSKILFSYTSDSIGLVAFHENLGLSQFYDKIIDLILIQSKQKNKKISSSEVFSFIYSHLSRSGYDLQSFSALFHLNKVLGLNGFSLFLNNACCSGLYAIEVAADLIRSRKCKAVIVVGADSPDVFKYLWFKDKGLYSSDGLIRPFSKSRNGFILGEGAASVILEDFDCAFKRGAEIYGEYLGGGFLSESWKMSLPAVSGRFYIDTIEKALKQSNLSPGDIDAVYPHGIGSKTFDCYEADALWETFGKRDLDPTVTALKPFIGHSLGVSTLMEVLLILLSLKNNLILPTLNFEESDPKIKINLNILPLEKKCKYILKTCSAFAGFDGAITIKSTDV